MRIPLISSVIVLAALLAPSAALACGGLFCSAANPVPVEQNAERILFTTNTDGSYSAYVEISYTGEPSAFSWVVPVPATPELGVVSPSTLLLLDLMTRPSIVAPPSQCSNPGSRTSFGCADQALAARSDDSGGVDVVDLARVGPYEPKVVSADDPSLVFDWLNTNGYLLTEQMRPYVTSYASKGMKFLALRLAPGTSTSDIAPIKMTYAAPCPMVPIALTAVSAEPEMGVLVMTLAPTRMRSTNYQNLEIKTADVRMDGAGRDNYYALVSRRIDEAGGRAFVTQLATPSGKLPQPSSIPLQTNDTQQAQNDVTTLVRGGAYFTRLYARLSAWEMTVDPEFEESDGDDVSNVFDLSDRPPIETCGAATRVACGGTYCGEGSECGVTEDGTEGCVCKAGTFARAVTVPDLRQGSVPGVTCQQGSFSVLFDLASLAPCTSFTCGGGRCVVTNGFPTCACDAGQVAILDPSKTRGTAVTGLLCETPTDTFGAGQLTWTETESGCAVGAGLPWALVGGFVLLARRRRS